MKKIEIIVDAEALSRYSIPTERSFVSALYFVSDGHSLTFNIITQE